MNLDFSTFPILKTERLILRQLTNKDAKQIHKLRSDPSVNRFIGRTNSTGVEEATEFIKKIVELVQNNQGMYWVIVLKDNTDLIGTICYWNFDVDNEIVEMGYEMLPEFQGKGIMIEAVKRVIEYGFKEMKAKTITALPSADNKSSIALLKKAKFNIDNKSFTNTHENVDNTITYILENKSILSIED